ncbi:CsgG/HfaB family protein [Allosphingosinicella humi]
MADDGRSFIPETSSMAVIPKATQTQRLLQEIPAPSRPVAVAVYGFTDQTGQFKPSETGQTLSRAVTQGAGSILVKALQDAGNRQWFTIVEREQLKNLLNERQIIREMRERYLGEQGVNPQALPALLFAGVLLEGGIIGYDTNTVTGGAGAGFLGIGAHTEYRQDTVTVYLRAVSVRTGEVLTTVTASKTIASKSLGASAFRFVAFKELLEAEAGFTTNEPDQLALQQAIEKAVYGLIMEGVDLKLWDFADPKVGWPMLWRYREERAGNFSAAQVEAAMAKARESAPLRIKPEDKSKEESRGGSGGR